MGDRRVPQLDTTASSVIRVRPLLDGVRFGLVLRWSATGQTWGLAIYTAEGEPLDTTIRLVVSTSLLAAISDERAPAGQLWLHDTTGRRQEAGRLDIGRRHRLLYRVEADVAEFAGDPARLV